MSLENLQQYSASTRELVLPLPLALEAIALMEQLKIPVFGWEGWIRLPGGRLGHSALHQGTAFECAITTSSEYTWLKQTIQESYDLHQSPPEAPSIELLFCITTGA
ncbi:hypothetical protein VUJ49_17730 [Pseudomonas berkeleyensis]|uniref:Uncharacterized protein n=1 Tax=Pseudomonas berkeleyensis TaxID=2726956 RepID=A0A7G5DJC9_9PSED|nr:hypothetical protein [Pseudomonas berkeleyensis]QMV61854.1 hypothetical protein HS968_17655 [Pseudomonas berkeleyensis]WSO37286.1 hypothetical protein VUJ49_17730 [Pseudomonas berkeleyensis]